ncbi:LamG domain-containing protein [Corallococcus sp. M34]|uniref:LamG domain-containing protein n=1 Tax=Citreicoccus inhibens TaxID=2849499 RepID=UPI001C22E80A|nr:LamG domain-containing protein [Citreicoccus inhibens]MBU8896734.1 LamG domain-containing protein [Citreicoccus inhibens]
MRLYDFPLSPANVQPITPGSSVHVENGLPATQALSAFSVECWVRPRNAAPWQGHITQHTYPSAYGFGLFLANGRVCAYLGNGGAFQDAGLFTGPSVPEQEWSHLALTWNGQQVALYLHGQYASGNAFTGPLVPGSAPPRLGAYGSLDDARVGGARLTSRDCGSARPRPAGRA